MEVRRVVPNLKASAPLERTRHFYEELIGLELAMDLGWIVTFRSRSNATAQLSVLVNDATAPVHPDVSIEVEDVDAVHRKAEAAGAEIVHPLTDEPWGVRRFFVRDPNGAVINVLAHRPTAR
jgi:predicted enzyme related to lactoylglutathione lyase